MDAKQTGAFIAQLRKEKSYTQKELAQQLHVSDKAISRWETGKGFPETSLLKPLSDALGISIGELLAGERIRESNVREQMDAVIVKSMKTSERKISKVRWACIGLAVLTAVLCALAVLPLLHRKSAVAFVNESRTEMLYALGAGSGGTFYNDMESAELENGWECYAADGTQRYVFLKTDGNPEPIMSYLHRSGEGRLFGFAIGEATVIQPNEALGVAGGSLTQYLKAQGFRQEWEPSEFGRPTLVYINGERCNWFIYTKENVYIGICLSAYEGCRLMAYDIGLRDSPMDTVWERMRKGYPLTLEDPCGLVTELPAGTYLQWETVTIGSDSNQALYLYMNGKLAGKFQKTVTFPMPGTAVTVRIVPKEKCSEEME